MRSDEVGKELRIRRRRLPHWQVGGSIYHVRFNSARGDLQDEARRILRHHILFDHGRRYDLHVGAIMLNHVHMLIQPTTSGEGSWHSLSEIMKSLKGVSSRRINQALGTAEAVWQDESFDRIIRTEAEYLEKWQYIWENPVRAGLIEDSEGYEFIVLPP